MQRGFTLLELLLVMIIVSVLGGVAIMNWPGQNLEQGVSVQRLVSDIRYAQLRVMACENCDRGEMVFSVNPPEYRFFLYRDATATAEAFADGEMIRDLEPTGLSFSGTLGFDATFGEPTITLPPDSGICVFPETGYVEAGPCS